MCNQFTEFLSDAANSCLKHSGAKKKQLNARWYTISLRSEEREILHLVKLLNKYSISMIHFLEESSYLKRNSVNKHVKEPSVTIMLESHPSWKNLVIDLRKNVGKFLIWPVIEMKPRQLYQQWMLCKIMERQPSK